MEEEEHSRRFQSLSQFVNPITSLHALKPSESEKSKDPRKRGPRVKVLATNSDERATATNRVCCERTGHSLHKCYKFMDETV